MNPASLQPAALNPLTGRNDAPGGAMALEAERMFDRVAQGAREKSAKDEQTLRGIAEEFVGMTFIAPLLEQARSSAFRVERFHGGFAEDAFTSQLDSELARRLARRDRTGLVDAIVDRYLQHGRTQTQRTDGVDLNA